MNDSLVIQLKGSVNDDSLIKLNEVRMEIVKTGNDVNTIRIGVKASATEKVKLTFLDACGIFYSDAAGTTGVGSSVELNAGSNIIYAKATKNGILSIENFHGVERLGATGQWSPSALFISNISTGFYAKINVDDLVWNKDLSALNFKSVVLSISDLSIFSDMTKLDTFHSQSNNAPFGSSSIFSTSNLWNFSLNSVNADIDINDFNPKKASSDMTLEINTSKTTRYTGGRDLRFPAITWLNLLGASMPTSEVDNLLISISQSKWAYGRCVIRGSRTSASDDAVATLSGKGVTVTLI